MKKTLYWIMIWMSMLSLGILPSFSFASWFGDDPLDLVPGIDVIKTNEEPSSSLLDTIKSTINWVLWILATVALVICMYAWFKMLTSWGDSKWYDSGVNILKNAALWLVIIGLSWLIVSAIIWFIKLQWWDDGSIL